MSKMAQNCSVVIQSCDILGHMVKCYYVTGSIRYWTYVVVAVVVAAAVVVTTIVQHPVNVKCTCYYLHVILY